MSGPQRRPPRVRADVLLVERGLAPSREKAQALLLAGVVSSSGQRIDKPGALLDAGADLQVASPPRFVGRGGEKLDGALTSLGLDVSGFTALDVGASTGGFTDCLLQRGAERVVALDVGRGQLDWKLRNDPRVDIRDGINVRYLDPAGLTGQFDLIVVDVSFISLRLVLPVLPPLLRRAAHRFSPEAALLVLVKPQFEVGREAVGKGGIVRDPGRHLEALLGIMRFARSLAAGPPEGGEQPPLILDTAAVLESPIRGAEGNREFFLLLRPGPPSPWDALEERARSVVTEPQRTG